MDTTVRLLKETDDLDEITVRDITERAGVNVSMVNYHFGSKDQLFSEAIGVILEDEVGDLNIGDGSNPKERLRRFLINVCRTMLDFEKYSKGIIPSVLLKDPIEVPKVIVPVMMECTGRTEMDCRMRAYEMVTFLQLIFYRLDDAGSFLGLDLRDPGNMERMIDGQMEIFLR